MRHVSEGTLHAYLDGELEQAVRRPGAVRKHLIECETCSARLEAERALREEVASMLHRAEWPVEPPPLEDLRRRAELSSKDRARTSPRQRAAWAASIAAALFLGWLLGGRGGGGDGVAVALGEGGAVEVAEAAATVEIEARAAVEPTGAVVAGGAPARPAAAGAEIEVPTAVEPSGAGLAEIVAVEPGAVGLAERAAAGRLGVETAQAAAGPVGTELAATASGDPSRTVIATTGIAEPVGTEIAGLAAAEPPRAGAAAAAASTAPTGAAVEPGQAESAKPAAVLPASAGIAVAALEERIGIAPAAADRTASPTDAAALGEIAQPAVPAPASARFALELAPVELAPVEPLAARPPPGGWTDGAYALYTGGAHPTALALAERLDARPCVEPTEPRSTGFLRGRPASMSTSAFRSGSLAGRALGRAAAPAALAAALACEPQGPPAEAIDAAAATITERDFAWRVGVIAHDSMGGRDTPSPGLEATAAWIAAELEAMGAQGAAEDGGFIQRYPLRRVVFEDPENPESAPIVNFVPAGAAPGGGEAPEGDPEIVWAPNVVAIIPGSDPELAGEHVVYSAHMDHVGMHSPDESGDSIFNGADDDASGTAAVLEAAQAIASLEPRPRRSSLFLFVSGEEKGLWGSGWFSENPTVPMESIVANLNADMVGRNWTDTIVAIGKGYSSLGPLLDGVSASRPELGMTPIDDLWPEQRFFCRSDHYHFARKGVPILFLFNGTHEDYHGRNDEPDRIDAEKAARVSKLLFHAGVEVANAPERPIWNAGFEVSQLCQR